MPKAKTKGLSNGGSKTPYFKPSDAQKIGLVKKMIDLKQFLFGRLHQGQFFQREKSRQAILNFANDDMKMNYQNMKALRAALATWNRKAYSKFDHNKLGYICITSLQPFETWTFFSKTGNDPVIYTEIDNLVLDLLGRDNKSLTLINLGDTTAGEP